MADQLIKSVLQLKRLSQGTCRRCGSEKTFKREDGIIECKSCYLKLPKRVWNR